MPRQARIDMPGALHHIIVRGIERRNIFADDQDRFDFVDRLGSILTKTQTTCYAWALIPNHFHLLLKTGPTPITSVMQRLLTGHAVRFNKRHNRSGHLFQNRYKSILCQEDTYLLELVRYIHLNPLRAGLVSDMDQLGKYLFSGHTHIMGHHDYPWQHRNDVLLYFSDKTNRAVPDYQKYVAEGIDLGKRKDLTGGGLLRCAGGWTGVKALRREGVHMKSDERILGSGDFVTEIMEKSEQRLERSYALKSRGVDLAYVSKKVSDLMDIPEKELFSPGRHRKLSKARSLLCFWAVREVGISMAAMADRLNISTAAVSKSVRRGSEMADKEGYEII